MASASEMKCVVSTDALIMWNDLTGYPPFLFNIYHRRRYDHHHLAFTSFFFPPLVLLHTLLLPFVPSFLLPSLTFSVILPSLDTVRDSRASAAKDFAAFCVLILLFAEVCADVFLHHCTFCNVVYLFFA